MASSCAMVTCASRRADSITGTIFFVCSRAARLGTTPPHGAWMAIWDETTLESTRAVSPDFSTTAAAVSSQDVSRARIIVVARVRNSWNQLIPELQE